MPKESNFNQNDYDTLDQKKYSKYASFLLPESIIFFLFTFLMMFC